MRERAKLVGPSPERDEILKKVKKAETAVEIDRTGQSIQRAKTAGDSTRVEISAPSPIFRNKSARGTLALVTARPLANIDDENADSAPAFSNGRSAAWASFFPERKLYNLLGSQWSWRPRFKRTLRWLECDPLYDDKAVAWVESELQPLKAEA
jgi:hypothetical protein